MEVTTVVKYLYKVGQYYIKSLEILIDKYVNEKYKDKFSYYHEWKKWSMIDKNIKKKDEVKRPDFWIVNRSKLLGIVS
jgi:hypothetical protein